MKLRVGSIILALICLGFLTACDSMGFQNAIVNLGILSQSDPPEPEIKYGEFPFTLVYEINGERKVVKDTLICEYDGIGANAGLGKFREWKSRLASGNERILLWNERNVESIHPETVENAETRELYFYPGDRYLYMGDADYWVDIEEFPTIFSYETYGEKGYEDAITQEEQFEQLNLKLINWEHAPPIKNKFG